MSTIYSRMPTRANLLAGFATPALVWLFFQYMFSSLQMIPKAWGFMVCADDTDSPPSHFCWDIVLTPNPCSDPPPPSLPPTQNSFLMHMLLMSIAFGVLAPLGAVSFSVLRDFLSLPPLLAKAVHGLIALGAVVASVLGFLEEFYEHGGTCEPSKGPHFQSMHSWLGIVVLVVFWLQGPSALIFLSNTRLLKPGGYWRSEFRRYHLFLGYFGVFGGLLSIATGILAFEAKETSPGDPYPVNGSGVPCDDGEPCFSASCEASHEPPDYWWHMMTAGAFCLALCFVVALAIFEARVPPMAVSAAPKSSSSKLGAPLLASRRGGGGEADASLPVLTLSEVAAHASEDDCWLVVHGKVYDVTSFLAAHPGGRRLLLQYKGRVADAGFDQSHGPSVLTTLPPSALVGVVEGKTSSSSAPSPAEAPLAVTPDGRFLQRQRPAVRQRLVLGAREQLSHDVVRFRFILPADAPILGLPVGKHLKLYAPSPALRQSATPGEWNGRSDPEAGATEVERPYTPTTSDDERGYVDLVVKVYRGGEIERFPDGGKMSQYLDSLTVGSQVALSGPWGHVEYVSPGLFSVGAEQLAAKRVGMLAGGTGITPMLQVIAAMLKSPLDATTISLIYANQTEDDILVRADLEALAAAHPARLKLWYTLDRPPAGWAYGAGFVNAEMIARHLPPPADDTLVLMCGPPPMIKFACQKNLNALGYAEERQVCF